jgi:hypothetical protein
LGFLREEMPPAGEKMKQNFTAGNTDPQDLHGSSGLYGSRKVQGDCAVCKSLAMYSAVVRFSEERAEMIWS